jgi:5-deoxy-glucuronate isomerase
MNHLIRPATTQSETIVVTPASAGWQYLSFRVVALAAGQGYTIDTGGEEMALVPLQGSGLVQVGGRNFSFSAAAVFVGPPSLVYAPPGQTIRVTAQTAFEFAVGGAPADGQIWRAVDPRGGDQV